MTTFIVKLMHPDGKSERKFARHLISGKLAITQIKSPVNEFPFARFGDENQALTCVEQHLARASEFIPDYPKYEIVVVPSDET